ncbi:MAG: FUSC family protein [Bacteroidota bacterium]
MEKSELLALSDEELLEKGKKMKSSEITHALLIGFMVGIVIYSVAQNTWGFLTLIPLFLIYRFMGDSKANNVLKAVLKERNLKV